MTDFTLDIAGHRRVSGTLALDTGPVRRLGVVLTNFQRYGMSRPTMNGHNKGNGLLIAGLPDTCKLFNSQWVIMKPALQWFWFTCLKLSAPTWSDDDLFNAWRQLTRGDAAFTNLHGHNNGYADYIRDVNVGEKAMSFEPIVTGGAILEIIGDPVRLAGMQVDHWPIAVIDARAAMPDPATVLRGGARWPGFTFDATISRREGYDPETGKFAREDLEIPFGMLGGRSVPVPVWTMGDRNWIPCDRVRILQPGEAMPSPYNF